MFAAHLAMRTVGEAESLSRRALCAAVHLSPSSVRSWARLGAVVTDSAVDLPPTSIPATDDGTSQDYVSSELAESCVAVAESQAMFSVLSKSRDAGLAAAGASGAAGGGATAASPEVTAVELASSLSDQAKAMLCGGKPGSSAGAVKAAARAVHVYPGAVEAWQSLGAALVCGMTSTCCSQYRIVTTAPITCISFVWTPSLLIYYVTVLLQALTGMWPSSQYHSATCASQFCFCAVTDRAR